MNTHLNLNVRGLGQSATLAINERSNALRSQGRRIYKLGLGQSPFPVPLPVVEALRANAFQKDYLPVKGLPALRHAVAEYLRGLHEIPCTSEDVLIAPGSKELMFLIQLCYYGDLVIPSPSWVSYAPQARIIGRNVTWIPTDRLDDWRLNPANLDRLCRQDRGRPRILILNYPNNPTGLTYTEEQLQALAAVAAEHNLVLLSDEIYGELHHHGEHMSIARFYPEGTIISGGLSKWCGAGGWRLGTFTFPRSLRWLLEAMASVASETYTSTSAPIQHAAVRAFEGGSEIQDYLKQARRVLASIGRFIAGRLSRTGIHVPVPEGGFYAFPDFSPLAGKLRSRGLTTSAALCTRLLDDLGVALLPGSDFGRPPEELTARLAYVDFDGAHCLTAAAQHAVDEHFLRQHCGNVVTAVESICAWLED